NNPPLWAAVVRAQPEVTLYGFGDVVIVGWRTYYARPGSFVVTNRMGVNQAPQYLHKVPRDQLPSKQVQLFASHPQVTDWVRSTGVFNAFLYRFGRGQPWYFTFCEGVCYVHTLQNTWQNLDDIMRTVMMLEQSFGAPPAPIQ